MTKVSIIVPCYNAVEYLDKCLASLLNQTLKDIEIIAIDDGSKDNTLALLQAYQSQFPNIIKVYTHENTGVAMVRNWGLELAQGEYIGFVDSDDYVEKDMYETMYNAAKEKDANIVISNYFMTYPDHEEEREEYPYQNTEDMLVHIYAVLWNKIYKKEWLDSLQLEFPKLTRHEDASFLLRLALHYERFVYVNKAFYHYVQRPTSITYTNNNKTRDAISMLNGVKEYYISQHKEEEYKDELEYVFIRFCLGDPYRYTCKIEDKTQRKEALTLLWNQLNDNYPNWKQNRYLNSLPGLKHKYWKMMNKTVFFAGSSIFSKIS